MFTIPLPQFTSFIAVFSLRLPKNQFCNTELIFLTVYPTQGCKKTWSLIKGTRKTRPEKAGGNPETQGEHPNSMHIQ